MPKASARSPAMSRRHRHPALRTALMVLGVILILMAGVVGPLPGPGGIFFFAGGLVLILQNSHWARVRFAKAKRRWPRFGHLVDGTLRRTSWRRRRERDERLGIRPPAVTLKQKLAYLLGGGPR